jgi:hypothetical protein
MPRRKFTDAQIAALVVEELENGARVEDVCRKLRCIRCDGVQLEEEILRYEYYGSSQAPGA